MSHFSGWRKAAAHPQRSRHETGRMNGTEESFAQHLGMLRLAGIVAEFAFEPVKLRLADSTWFILDFLVQTTDGTLLGFDVKGTARHKKSGTPYALTEGDARVKINVAAKEHPWLTFFVARPGTRDEGGGWIIKPIHPEDASLADTLGGAVLSLPEARVGALGRGADLSQRGGAAARQDLRELPGKARTLDAYGPEPGKGKVTHASND